MSRDRLVERYLPFVYLALAALLAVFVLPSTLRPPIQPILLDKAFKAGEVFRWNKLDISCQLTPGNSPAAMTYQVQLNGQFTAFAQVVEGIEVIDKISTIPTDENQIGKGIYGAKFADGVEQNYAAGIIFS